MDLMEHGGACCGMSHIFNFPYEVNERHVNRIKDIISQTQEDLIEGYDDSVDYEEGKMWPKNRQFNHAFEVVLTDHQMMRWAQTLKGMGFKRLYRWKNHNSGNYCTLLVYTPQKRCTNPAPYKW